MIPTHVLYLPMKCTGEAGESLDLSLQGQGFLVVFVLDHSLRCLHHLSERDLPSVPQHHAEHVVVLPGKKKLVIFTGQRYNALGLEVASLPKLRVSDPLHR